VIVSVPFLILVLAAILAGFHSVFAIWRESVLKAEIVESYLNSTATKKTLRRELVTL